MIPPFPTDRTAARLQSGPRPRAPAAGFSLIELMFTIALAGVLTAVAAPSVTKLLKTNRVQSEASSFVGDLMFARTEAVKRGQNVSVCVSSDGVNCLTTNTWQSGWIVFSDSAAACAGVTGTTPMLRTRKAFTGGDTFAASQASSTCVTFNREGFTSNLGTALVTFTLHTSDTLAGATRCVTVDLGGRMVTRKAGEVPSCS